MALMSDSWFTDIVAICLSIAVGIITYYKHAFQYWNKKNVPHWVQPKFPFGTIPNPIVIKTHVGEIMKREYSCGKSHGHKHGGGYLFLSPKYFPIDVEYIKNILQRDSNHFTERGFYYNEKDDPLSANLFALGGEKWRILRTKLSPAFTSGKMRLMFDDMLHCAHQMQDAIGKNCENGHPVNISEVSECFTIDVIGSCVFGLDCNSFKNPEAEFRKQGKRIFSFTTLRVAKATFAFGFPKIARWLGIRLFDKDMTKFFTNVVKETLQYRKVSDFSRKDFLQLLLELENSANSDQGDKLQGKPKFAIEELTAQVFIFFAAGFETSSLTIAFCLYELATHSDIQNKVRKEINEILVRDRGKITYDTVADMKYLNQVVEETLRKYPPVPFITRVCVKDYEIPGTNTTLEAGIEAVISILGLHHDPEYYPNPDKFDPERFSEENKQTGHPFTYMPFGEGPRICIGLRFGLMQTKIGLISLLKHYRFLLSKRTKIPLQMNPYAFTLMPKSGIFLEVQEVIA